MNPKLLAVCLTGLLCPLAHADDVVRVIGPVADGTPAPAAPALPKLDVAPGDILETRTHQLEDRKIILQKITPVDLPSSPDAAPQAHNAIHNAARETSPSVPQTIPPRLLLLSATVYHSSAWPDHARTCFHWTALDHQHEFTAWSNIDAHWLGGFTGFQSGNTPYSLLLTLSEQDLDQAAANATAQGRPYTAPTIPELPTGDPTYLVTQGNATPEELAPLTALHQLIRTDGETLRLAYAGREQARLAKEAALQANPPSKDIVLRYWRVQPPAAPTNNAGADQ